MGARREAKSEAVWGGDRYKELCVGNDADGSQREWVPHVINFDHFGKATRALFILATMDDWTSHMWAGVDSTGRLTGPTGASPCAILVCVAAD